jgi:hypothetical protein
MSNNSVKASFNSIQIDMQRDAHRDAHRDAKCDAAPYLSASH